MEAKFKVGDRVVCNLKDPEIIENKKDVGWTAQYYKFLCGEPATVSGLTLQVSGVTGYKLQNTEGDFYVDSGEKIIIYNEGCGSVRSNSITRPLLDELLEERKDEVELLAVSGLNIPKGVSQEVIQAFRETLDKINDKSQSALDKQVSGSHYKDFKIQPAEYCHANNIPFLEGNVIKYASRHKAKNKAADIKKAIHCLELILQLEYGE